MEKNATRQIWIHALGAKAGGGITYLNSILPELLDQLEGKGIKVVLLLPRPLAGIELPQWVEARVMPMAARNPITRFFFDQVALPLKLKGKRGVSLYCSGSFSPLIKPAPTIALLRNAIYFDNRFLERETWLKRLSLRAQGRLITLGARNCEAIHYPSNSMRELVEARAPRLIDRGFVNHYGIGKAFRDAAPDPRASSKEKSPATFLYVMNYTLQKNLGFLLRALALARRESLPVRAVVTSWLDRGPKACFAQDRALIEVNELVGSGYLSPVGPKYEDDLIALYRSVDACIFPSICESFGHPLLEAIAMGKPLICSDLPFAREICGDYPVYVNTNRPEELFQVWKEWPLYAQENTLASRQSALSQFSWRKHVANLIESLTKGDRQEK
jgi:glycosyltransferase involved in cell wall biosynthesis